MKWNEKESGVKNPGALNETKHSEKKDNDRSERLEGKEDKEESLRNSRKKDKSRYFKKWTLEKKASTEGLTSEK